MRRERSSGTATTLCAAAAAELIASYALFPGFDPGSGYVKAVTVLLILDALGTIVAFLPHRWTAASSAA